MNTLAFVQFFLYIFSTATGGTIYSPGEEAGVFYYKKSSQFFIVRTPQSTSIPSACRNTYRSYVRVDNTRLRQTIYACPPDTPGVTLSSPTLATYGNTFCRSSRAKVPDSTPATTLTLTGPEFKVGGITYYPRFSCEVF